MASTKRNTLYQKELFPLNYMASIKKNGLLLKGTTSSKKIGFYLRKEILVKSMATTKRNMLKQLLLPKGMSSTKGNGFLLENGFH